MSRKPRKQVILAAYFPGVNNTTVWSRPAVEEPDRVRVVRPPRPDGRARQARLLLPRRRAAPARAARQDPRPRHRRAARHADRAHRAGRGHRRTSAWPARSTPRSTSRTSWPASWPRSTTCRAGGRRGTWSRRPTRSPARTSAAAASSTTPTATCAPASSSSVARELWDSWARRRDRRRRSDRARSCATAPPGAFAHRGAQFDIARQLQRAAQPAGPPGHPAGRRQRRRAASWRRAPPTPSSAGTPRSPTGRRSTPTPRAGWPSTAAAPDELKILPAVSFVLGDTPRTRPTSAPRTSAASRSARRRRSCCSSRCGTATCRPTTPTARCPTSTPTSSATSIIQGRARMHPDPLKTAAEWRALAEAKQLSIRDLIIEATGRQTFVGTPSQVADADGRRSCRPTAPTASSWRPHLTPTGLDDFVDQVVPLLQERGVLRTEYADHDAARAPGAAAGRALRPGRSSGPRRTQGGSAWGCARPHRRPIATLSRSSGPALVGDRSGEDDVGVELGQHVDRERPGGDERAAGADGAGGGQVAGRVADDPGAIQRVPAATTAVARWATAAAISSARSAWSSP